MNKPDTIDGYDDNQTLSCERLLVTLLRGLEPLEGLHLLDRRLDS